MILMFQNCSVRCILMNQNVQYTMTEFLREITNDKLVPKVKTESKHNDLFESEETEEDEIYDDKS